MTRATSGCFWISLARGRREFLSLVGRPFSLVGRPLLDDRSVTSGYLFYYRFCMSVPTPAPPPDDLRVAEVLQKVRSGVRQRRAESTTLAAGGEETRSGLLALKTREYVQEPVAFSHRPGLGRLIVLARKAFYKLFLKWFMRPVLEQQNGYNQAAARLIEDLVESRERTARELRQLAGRVEALERRLEEGEHPESGGEGGA